MAVTRSAAPRPSRGRRTCSSRRTRTRTVRREGRRPCHQCSPAPAHRPASRAAGRASRETSRLRGPRALRGRGIASLPVPTPNSGLVPLGWPRTGTRRLTRFRRPSDTTRRRHPRSRRRSSRAGIHPHPHSRGARGHDGAVARLEPMTPTGLIDEAVHVLKARPRTIITIAVCFTVPVGIVVGFLQRGLLGGFSLGDILNDPSTADAASRSTAAPRRHCWRSCCRRSSFRSWPRRTPTWSSGCGSARRSVRARRCDVRAAAGGRAASWVLVHLAEGAASFFAIGGIVMMGFFLVTAPGSRSSRSARSKGWGAAGT